MGKGLREYEEGNINMKGYIKYRALTAGLLTFVWYEYARRVHIFSNQKQLIYSVGAVSLLSWFFGKGIGMQVHAAIKSNQDMHYQRKVNKERNEYELEKNKNK